MINLDLRFYMHSNCFITNGANRSIIVDTERNEFDFLPVELANNLLKYNSLTIKELFSVFEFDDIETVMEYFIYLVSKEYIFTSKLNVPIDYQIIPNTLIQKDSYISIIDIDDNIQNISDFITKVEKEQININIIQLRFYKTISVENLESVIALFNNTTVRNIQILGKFHNNLNSVIKLKDKYPRIKFINSYDSDQTQDNEVSKCNSCTIVKSKREMNSEKNCGKIDFSQFVKNIYNYSLSNKHNSCLFNKISLDRFGNIKNCPSMSESFGNIKDSSLDEVINKLEFKKYWNITKDQIEGCKDCEFRHICTDCRAFTEDPDNRYSKPLKCGYNPYTNLWEEWSVNPFKQKAIKYYGLQEIIN